MFTASRVLASCSGSPAGAYSHAVCAHVQAECHRGGLTVVLDLDGTLVSTYTPKRAPRLPPGCTSFLCGKGSKLNPSGVLVIERPGLRQFLKRLAEFAGKIQHKYELKRERARAPGVAQETRSRCCWPQIKGCFGHLVRLCSCKNIAEPVKAVPGLGILWCSV